MMRDLGTAFRAVIITSLSVLVELQ